MDAPDNAEIWKALDQYGTLETATENRSEGAFVPSRDVTQGVCFALACLLKQSNKKTMSKPIRYVVAKLREYNSWAKMERRRQIGVKVLALILFNLEDALESVRDRFTDDAVPKLPGLGEFAIVLPHSLGTRSEPTQQESPPGDLGSKEGDGPPNLSALLEAGPAGKDKQKEGIDAHRWPGSFEATLRELGTCCRMDPHRRPLGDKVAAAVAAFAALDRPDDAAGEAGQRPKSREK